MIVISSFLVLVISSRTAYKKLIDGRKTPMTPERL